MKKYITVAALLAAGTVCAHADTLTLFDQWTFDNNLTSTNGKTFSTQQANASYSNGMLSLSLPYENGACGIHLNDSNTLGLDEGNWAVQIAMNIASGQSGDDPNVLACLNNAVGGTQVAISNSDDGHVYGMAVAESNNKFGSWSANNRTNATAVVGELTTLTVLNFDGKLYLAQGKSWATFGSNADSLSLGDGDDTLGKLMIGFGQGGTGGLLTQTIVLADISVYTFDTEAGLASVKTALIAKAIPEPSAFGLLAGIGALALVASRRRRK